MKRSSEFEPSASCVGPSRLHEEPSADKPGGAQPTFSAALAAVDFDLRGFPFEAFSSAEPDPMLGHVRGLLEGIEFDADGFL